MLKWASLFLAFGIGLSAPAFAQKEMQAVRDVLTMSIRPDRDLSAAGRARYAEAFGAYCAELAGALPTNTPREADWVQAEMGTSDSNRLMRLVRSPEFSRHRLAEVSSECRDKVGKIRAAQRAGNVRDEAFWFVSLAVTLNNDRDITLHARQANVDLERHGIEWMSSFRYGLEIAALRAIESIP